MQDMLLIRASYHSFLKLFVHIPPHFKIFSLDPVNIEENLGSSQFEQERDEEMMEEVKIEIAPVMFIAWLV